MDGRSKPQPGGSSAKGRGAATSKSLGSRSVSRIPLAGRWRSFVAFAALLMCACAKPVADLTGAPASRLPAVTTDVVYGHKDGLALTFDVYRPSAIAF
jgi:hypothetical protein